MHVKKLQFTVAKKCELISIDYDYSLHSNFLEATNTIGYQ